jgi:hypothetical protein
MNITFPCVAVCGNCNSEFVMIDAASACPRRCAGTAFRNSLAAPWIQERQIQRAEAQAKADLEITQRTIDQVLARTSLHDFRYRFKGEPQRPVPAVRRAKPRRTKPRRTRRELYDYHRELWERTGNPVHLRNMSKHVPFGKDDWWWDGDKVIPEHVSAMHATEREPRRASKAPLVMAGGALLYCAGVGMAELFMWSTHAFAMVMCALTFIVIFTLSYRASSRRGQKRPTSITGRRIQKKGQGR